MKWLLAQWLFWVLLSLAAAGHADTTSKATDPLCADAGLWSGKLISDICWSCLFPIRAAGASLGGGNVPSIATDQKFCFCTDPMGIPQLGMTIGLWNPARLIEVVRNPWCSPALGGHTFSASKVRLIATTGKGDFDASEMSFFNYHYFAFPLTILLDLFWDDRCNADGYRDFDLLYVSELDPTWNSDLLAFFTSPGNGVVCQSGGHCRLCRRCGFCCHRSSAGCLVLVCRCLGTYVSLIRHFTDQLRHRSAHYQFTGHPRDGGLASPGPGLEDVGKRGLMWRDDLSLHSQIAIPAQYVLSGRGNRLQSCHRRDHLYLGCRPHLSWSR